MTVLLVEDSRTMRLLIRLALGRMDELELVEAVDGADAVAKLETLEPDVILTDVHMPGIDGFALIEHVRALPQLKDTPIVVLTRAGSQRDRDRASALDVAAYVTKPIRQNKIVETLRRVAGASR